MEHRVDITAAPSLAVATSDTHLSLNELVSDPADLDYNGLDDSTKHFRRWTEQQRLNAPSCTICSTAQSTQRLIDSVHDYL